MERGEPTLVPEWLKGTGNVTGGGSTTHHFASSSLHSDDHAATHPTRNRSSVSINDYDSPRSSTILDRTSSSYFRRSSSSNGSMINDKEHSSYSQSYSSFTRNHRDRDWEKDTLDYRGKERSVPGDLMDHDLSDTLSSIFPSRNEKDSLRRSHSLISAKRGDVWPRRGVADSNSGNNGNHNSCNGLLGGGSVVSSMQKAAFERDFPSLGAEERQGAPDLGRVSPPGLSNNIQSLAMVNSSVIGGDGWTSALAEVPVIIGSNNLGLSSAQQTVPVSSVSTPSSTITGLNMAETLAQAPSRARTTPQVSVETQRLEELAIKQSRQLIPMTPSMPKALASNSAEKAKPKTVGRTGEMSAATKIGQHQALSSHHVNQSFRGGPVRSDVSKASHGGKLLILKTPREKNGVLSTAKDGSSPTNAGGRVANTPLAVAPSPAYGPLRSPNNPKPLSAERKAGAGVATHGSSLEKRPTLSQAQSRNDFFNSMRRKSSANLPVNNRVLSTVMTSQTMEKSVVSVTEVATPPVSPQGSDALSSDSRGVDWPTENMGDMTSNGDANEVTQRFCDINEENHSSLETVVFPDEEEVAFLRSLGWDENGGEEEGLTEEEIKSFLERYTVQIPSSKLCRGTQPKFSLPIESHVGSLGGASSGLSSSDSEAEA